MGGYNMQNQTGFWIICSLCIAICKSSNLANLQIGQASLPVGRLARWFADCSTQSANYPEICLFSKSCEPISWRLIMPADSNPIRSSNLRKRIVLASCHTLSQISTLNTRYFSRQSFDKNQDVRKHYTLRVCAEYWKNIINYRTDFQIGGPICKSAGQSQIGRSASQLVNQPDWTEHNIHVQVYRGSDGQCSKIDASCRVSINKAIIQIFDFFTKATIVCRNEGRQHVLCWHESWKCGMGSGKLHRPEVSASLQSRRTNRRS